jgi:sulfate permease, SulP family
MSYSAPLLAIIAIGFMIVAKRLFKNIPLPLVGLLCGSVAYLILLSLFPSFSGVQTLTVPDSWIPTPYVMVEWPMLQEMFFQQEIFLLVITAGISMAALASFDTVFSLTALEEITGKKENPDRELLAHGIANAGAALFGGLIGAGGLNRTRPAMEDGVSVPIWHIFSALVMAVAIILGKPLLGYIPNAVVAGVVLYIVLGLFDKWVFTRINRETFRDFRANSDVFLDAFIMSLVIGVAIPFGLVTAVCLGIVLSILFFVHRSSRNIVHSIVRGTSAHSRLIRNTREKELLTQHASNMALLKLNGSLFFGTARDFQEQAENLINSGVNLLTIDMKKCDYIDITGARTLIKIQDQLAKLNGQLRLSYIQETQQSSRNNNWQILKLANVIDHIQLDCFHFDTDGALIAQEEALLKFVSSVDPSSASGGWTRSSLLAGLTGPQFQSLRPILEERTYQKDDVIFRQGDDGDGAYFIIKGKVDILLEVSNSQSTKRLQTYAAGSCFGEMALLTGRERSAAAVATESTKCFFLVADRFKTLKTEMPEASLTIIGNLCITLASRLTEANELISELET